MTANSRPPTSRSFELSDTRYQIEREVGRGGMAVVYRAFDTRHERHVAIKVVNPEFATGVTAERFLSEIQVAARLTHPHILPVHDSGQSGEDLYYVMPFVAGRTLRDHLESEGRLSVKESVRIVNEVASALDYAHREGVLHRDVKPENILLEDGQAVLADFGLAHALSASGGTRLTTSGVLLGTPQYMSPEQAKGERDLDGRSDQYSLACVLYEMLAGSPPFTGGTPQAVLFGHMLEPTPEIRQSREDVPRHVEMTLRRALSKAPDDRFPTMADFARALAGPEGEHHQLNRGTRLSAPAVAQALVRRPALPLLALVLAVILGAWFASRRDPADLDGSLLAVAPFSVLKAGSEWREGLVDLLSRDLDDQGTIRTVPPSRFLRGWDALPDRRSAAQLGRRLGAGLVLYGSITGVGNDSVMIDASVLDVASDRIVGSSNMQVRGPNRNVAILAQQLTIAVLQQLRSVRQIGAFRQTALATTALPALKAFLEGEQFYRRSAWDSAVSSYEQALRQDSTFALPASRLGQIMRWRRGGDDREAERYLFQAGRFNHGLSRRDSMLILSDSLRAGLISFERDTGYFARARRVFALLEQARDEFPEDPEIWYALGEAYYHHGHGPRIGISESGLLAVFDRAVALDPGFAPAYIHPIEHALALGDEAAARSYMRRYLALDPTDSEAEGVSLLAGLLAGESSNGGPPGDSLVPGMGADPVYVAWRAARHWPDSTGIALRLAKTLESATPHSNARFLSGDRRIYLTLQLAFAGHMQEAGRRLEPDFAPRLFTEIALLGGVPRAAAENTFDRWVAQGSTAQWAPLAWWAAHADTTRLLLVRGRADSSLRAASAPLEQRDHLYRRQAADAYLALARGDTTSALERLLALPDTLCLLCYYDRLTQARLLAAAGQTHAADSILQERLPIMLTPVEVLFALERGRVEARLGHNAAAMSAYRAVVCAWSKADRQLQPMVREARAALVRLRSARQPVGG